MASTETDLILPKVTIATEQDRLVISNMLQLMLYELSPLFGEWIGRDGRYPYDRLENYWVEPDRYPYLIHRQEQLTGFALVLAHSPISGRASRWFMAEFFILRAQRQRGYGQAALGDILSKHRGNWEIAAINTNRNANFFWKNALAKLDVENLSTEYRIFEKHEWTVHSFVS